MDGLVDYEVISYKEISVDKPSIVLLGNHSDVNSFGNENLSRLSMMVYGSIRDRYYNHNMRYYVQRVSEVMYDDSYLGERVDGLIALSSIGQKMQHVWYGIHDYLSLNCHSSNIHRYLDVGIFLGAFVLTDKNTMSFDDGYVLHEFKGRIIQLTGNFDYESKFYNKRHTQYGTIISLIPDDDYKDVIYCGEPYLQFAIQEKFGIGMPVK